MSEDRAEGDFRRLSPLTPVVRGPILLLAFAGASWEELLSGDIGIVGLLLIAALIAGVGYGFASWVRTKYWVGEDELRIDTGVLSRQSRRIRIDRLQGIDIVQPFLARVFGLAELKLDLAGGDREGSLAFLPLAEAVELKRQLLERRDAHRPAASTEGSSVSAPERLLARLDLGLLLASLALSTETLVLAMLTGAFVLGAVATAGSAAAVGGALPAVAGLVITLGRKLTGYYGFTVSESVAGLQVRRGMFSLSSQTVALHRVQGVAVLEPLLWRSFGWARLEVSLAGYEAGDSDKAAASSTLLPVAPRAEVLALARHVLAGRDPEAVTLDPPPRRSAWLAPLTWRALRFGMDSTLVVSRRGWFLRRLDVVPQERVQSFRLVQGPLQRLCRLADLHVDIPPGPVHALAAYRDPADARALAERGTTLSRAARLHQRVVWAMGHPVEVRQPSSGVTPPAPETTQ